jgi:ribosomal protein S13
MIFNPMLTGRLGVVAAGTKAWPRAAALFSFGPALSAAPALPHRARPLPAWPGGADWLPVRDGAVELRYRDATRMGKIYLMPDGVSRPVAGWAEQGPDADDPALTLEVWRERIGRHSGELKNLLRNQAFVAGIGNAYSDEILHRARLSPVALAARLSVEEVARLFEAARTVLREWTERLRAEAGGGFPAGVTAFREGMAVHGRHRLPCPVCGAPVQRIVRAENETDYCPRCQTGGRILSDRSLSRLLKDDWPRTLEDLERNEALRGRRG